MYVTPSRCPPTTLQVAQHPLAYMQMHTLPHPYSSRFAKRRKRSLGYHLIKHPAARAFNSLSMATKHDPIHTRQYKSIIWRSQCDKHAVRKQIFQIDKDNDTRSVNVHKAMEGGVMILKIVTRSEPPTSRITNPEGVAQRRGAGTVTPAVCY